MFAYLNRRRGGNSLWEMALAVAVGLSLAFVVLVLSRNNLPIKMVVLVVGCLGSFLVALTFGDVKRLLVLAIYLDTSIVLDFHLTCNEDYFLITCGFNVSLSLIALVVLYGLWLIDLRRADRVNRYEVKWGLPVTLAIAFVGAAALSIVKAPGLVYALYQLWIYVVVSLLLIYWISHIEGERDILFFLYSMAVGLLIQSVIMEAQGFGLVDNSGIQSSLIGQRITGTLHSPNVAGAYLAQVVLILLPLMFLKVARWQKWLLAVLLVLALHSLVGTESRAAWTSIAVGFFIILFWGLGKGWINIKSLMIVLLVLAVGTVLFSGAIIQRLTEDDNGSADARQPLAEIAGNMIRDNPVLGVGINNFGIVLYDYVEPDQYGAWLNIVHNQWLLIWSETGTVGFLIYLSLWLATGWLAFQLVRKNHPVYSVVALGILASLAGASTNMLSQGLAGRAQVQLIWIELAIIAAMSWLQRQEAGVVMLSRVSLADKVRMDD